MKKQKFYFPRVPSDNDFPYLAQMQIENSDQYLDTLQMQSNGFVPFILSDETLIKSRSLRLLKTAMRNKTGRIEGFACGLSPRYALKHKYLEPFAKTIPNEPFNSLIVSVCIRDCYRRQGLGRELMRRLIIGATRQGYQKLFAYIGNSNSVAVKFFSSVGFEKEVINDNIIMQRLLPQTPA